jgi:hypothetical protein
MSYIRIKWIKGHPYLYEQASYRVGAKVKTKHIRYIGKHQYVYARGRGAGGFAPPQGLSQDRKHYIDRQIDRLQLGNKFRYERDILRQYLYHQNYRFIGASGARDSFGYVIRRRSEGGVLEFGLQGKSDSFTWMHELGHSLEFEDQLIDAELQELRLKFLLEVRVAYLTAVDGDLSDKEAFITRFAPLIDLRRDAHAQTRQPKPLQERMIYRSLQMAKSGEMPQEAFARDFRAWVGDQHRLEPAEMFADAVAALILNPKHAFEAHTPAGKQYLSKVYLRLYTHLDKKYHISLDRPRRSEGRSGSA